MKPAEVKLTSLVQAVFVLAILFLGGTGYAPFAEAQSIGAFTAAGNMSRPRGGHTAVVLANGKILIAGGEDNVTFDSECGDPTILFSAELYDPSTGRFTSTGSMYRSRVGHTATLIGSGKVLMAGGDKENFSSFTDCAGTLLCPIASAELYDLSTGAFTPTKPMTKVRSGHTATLLRDGRVLITGGASIGGTDAKPFCPALDFRATGSAPIETASAEIFDPFTGTFFATGNLTTVRFRHSATLLADGRVLIAGGAADGTGSAEIYDPSTGIFSPTGSMTTNRYSETATLLPNGKVLITSGWNDQGIEVAAAEIFDPVTRTFSVTGSLTRPRGGDTASLLQDGTILLAGGAANGAPGSELYDPAANSFSITGNTFSFHAFHTASVLTNGTVLLAGGYAGRNAVARVELYDPNALRIATSVQRQSRDFNGDGRTDVLFRDAAGNVSIWLLNGYSVTGDNLIANIWPGWKIAGSGDFDGDGKSDILWRDTAGNVAIWLMDGSRVSSFGAAGATQNFWAIAGVADFNADGKSDILWRSATGDVAMWMMDGYTITSNNVIANIWIGWSIAGTGDFNSDGKSDILWRDLSGAVAIWLMDGNTVSSYDTTGANLPPTYENKWKVSAVADFDGDGRSDILWRNKDGSISTWLMNGTTVVSDRNVALIPVNWTIVGSGDFNGDGASDVLWRDSAGSMAIWLMDGTTIVSYSSMGNVSDRVAQ